MATNFMYKNEAYIQNLRSPNHSRLPLYFNIKVPIFNNKSDISNKSG